MSTRIARQAAVMRKAPRQSRSRATVAAIAEAGARILSEEGWAGFSTNKVAELAGVSIGSLYQYFPDKLSLVDAIRRRHLDDCLAVVQRARAAAATPAKFVELLVDGLIAAHCAFPGLHRTLLDEAPASEEYRNPNSPFELQYLAAFAGAIASFHGDAARSSLAARIVSDAIDGVIHNAARRGAISDPLVRLELIRLLRLYLESRPEASETAE